jgi:hypothetical protein
MHSGVRIPYGSPRALSSAGRAPALQAGGRRFDPVSAHHSYKNIAGWSSTVARRAHNPKVAGSNPVPATKTWSCGEVGVHAGLSHRRSRVRVPSAPPCFEPLAQLVEHLTFNQGVTGSSPVWLTIHAEVAELADAHDSKSCSVRSVGSTPTFGTIIIILMVVNHFRKSFRLL